MGSDLISRAAAIEAAFKGADDWDGGFNPKYLMAIPAVDAAPVVHARWIEDRTHIMCSACGARYKDEIVFMPDVYVNGKRYDGLEHCPHCGVRMDGGEP